MKLKAAPLNLGLLMFALLPLSGGRSQAAALNSTPANAHNWIAPIIQSFGQYGVSRVAELGVPSLSYFAGVDLNLKTRLENDPRGIQRLLDQLEADKNTPASFVALSVEERIHALKNAAQTAEKNAAAEAQRTFSAAHGRPLEKLSGEEVRELESAADQLWGGDLPYLSEDHRRGLEKVRGEIRGFLRRRQEQLHAFARELPQKIVGGVFNEKNVYSQADGKWLAADLSPFPKFDSLEQAFQYRIKEIELAPAGPWSQEVLGTMKKTLQEEPIRRALENEGGAERIKALHALLDSAGAQHAARLKVPDPKLERALAALRKYHQAGRIPAPWHIKRIYQHYDGLVAPFEQTLPPESAMDWRITHWISRGRAEQGYPAWDDLEALKRRGLEKAVRTEIYSFAVAVVCPIIAILLMMLGPSTSPWLVLALSVVCGVGFIVFLAADQLKHFWEFYSRAGSHVGSLRPGR